jgi:hypothetical protein
MARAILATVVRDFECPLRILLSSFDHGRRITFLRLDDFLIAILFFSRDAGALRTRVHAPWQAFLILHRFSSH